MGRLRATLTSLRRCQIPEYELWRQRTGECDVPELVWQEGSVVDRNWCQRWTHTDTHRAAQLEKERERAQVLILPAKKQAEAVLDPWKRNESSAGEFLHEDK